MKTWEIIKKRWEPEPQPLPAAQSIDYKFARNDILDLIEEVERLQASNAALLAACKSANDWMNNEINLILPGQTPIYQEEYLALVVQLDTAIAQAETATQ